ncbi:hypothetical protein FA15DRAFT_667093 [Coprinopsis marcescibilis]|uniref:PAH2 domain-containing protein n=1 Tax=Coprinopsis marcescibilis TaxID=230819 RepID=A0A5C3LEB8_COPMA|nr:hypothetical protein FA15DRAFT_667093 [Coprinopsis marcescibilis]
MESSERQYTQDEANIALNYLSALETRFADKPDVGQDFLSLMSAYQSKEITVMELVESVCILLFKHQDLLESFNHFLPNDWHVGSLRDEEKQNLWHVTIDNPTGTHLRRFEEVVSEDPPPLLESGPTEEFAQAIAFVNEVQGRYSSNPEVYQEFLGMLQKYNIGDDGVSKDEQQAVVLAVDKLFSATPDLAERFRTIIGRDSSDAQRPIVH